MATLRGSPPCTELLGGNRRNKKPRFTLPVNLTGAWYLNESKRVFFPCGAVEDHRHFRGSGSQFERSALSPRKLRDRPEMARSSGQRLAASLREMIFRCVCQNKSTSPCGGEIPAFDPSVAKRQQLSPIADKRHPVRTERESVELLIKCGHTVVSDGRQQTLGKITIIGVGDDSRLRFGMGE